MGGSQPKAEFAYTVPVPGSESAGQTPIFVAPNARPYLQWPLDSGAQTLYDAFKHSASTYPNNPCLGTRQKNPDGSLGQYVWKTYAEVASIASHIGYGLASLNLSQKNEEGHAFFGIYSRNCEEWMFMDIACMSQDIVSVPLYDVLVGEGLEFIIDLTEMPALACPADKVNNVISLKKEGKLPTLRIIVVFEDPGDQVRSTAGELGVRVLSLHELQHLSPVGENRPPQSNSLYTLCFTSGTTGNAKGAMLTHQNLVLTIAGIAGAGYEFYPTDIHISYLPLAHMFERVMMHKILSAGGSAGFFGGNVMKLREDLAILRPTLFISVPRLYNRFYDTIIQQFNSIGGVKKYLLNQGLASKRYYYQNSGTVNSPVWDKILFKRIQGTFGGRIRLMITGSAPISGEVLSLLRVVFSCPIVEGYGQTETSAGSLVTAMNDSECGHVGGPTPTVELKLMDVPDMNFYSTDVNEEGLPTPRGEICFRGPTIFLGYYKSPQQTQEAIDEDGWLHSGDIGVRLPHNGAFKLIDRKKMIFKLAQGEYVSPEKLEIVFTSSFLVAQIFVYGDSLQSTLVAVIVPDEAFIRKNWLADKGVDPNTPWSEVCAMKEIKDDIAQDLQKRGKECGIKGYEFIRAFHIESAPWTSDDLLTPTHKLKWFKARDHYREILNQLYNQ